MILVWLLYKIHNVIIDFLPIISIIIVYTNAKNFEYNDYQTVFAFNSLSYLVWIVALLRKCCKFFWLK